MKKLLILLFLLSGCFKREVLSLIEIENKISNTYDYELYTLSFNEKDKVYEAILYDLNHEYHYVINAYNGNITKEEVKKIEYKSNEITDEFVDKALSFYHFKQDEVSCLNVIEDKKYHIYSISFYYDQKKYTCEYDINSKNLLKTEIT